MFSASQVESSESNFEKPDKAPKGSSWIGSFCKFGAGAALATIVMLFLNHNQSKAASCKLDGGKDAVIVRLTQEIAVNTGQISNKDRTIREKESQIEVQRRTISTLQTEARVSLENKVQLHLLIEVIAFGYCKGEKCFLNKDTGEINYPGKSTERSRPYINVPLKKDDQIKISNKENLTLKVTAVRGMSSSGKMIYIFESVD